MIRKVPFLHCFLNKNTQESGRSMVEILGVLAVIGVLSAGGIYGYSFAMDKYRANDIVYEVNLRANDIWHKYQEMPLPEPSEDGTDFDEFPDITGTGYPIYMTSHPDVAFKTYVEGVSSRVCKNVVNMNLNGVIQGIQFVQVNGTKYTGNASICGEDETDNTIVFTSFLDSENNEAGTGQSGDPCVEDTDCTSLCGTATCDTDKMICKNSCTGTANPHCFDNDGTGVCVECLTNKDCPSENQICDLTNHECVALPETCGEGERYGKEYRAANGSCVSCDYMSEIIIMNSDDNDGVFEKQVGGVSIKDTHSGIDMCNACQSVQHRIEEAGTGNNIKTYCATSCVKGNSFLSKDKGCIPCNSLEELAIPNEDQARVQCTSCPNRVWYRHETSNNANYLCVLRNCPNGYFKNYGQCRKCVYPNGQDWTQYHDFYAAVVWTRYSRTSAGNLAEEWSNECLQCANSSDPKLRANYQIAQQGSSGRMCTDICGKNQFQDSIGNCYDCDTDDNPQLGILNGWMSHTWLQNLCTSCTTAKREVQSDKCVKVRNNDCSSEEVLSFMGDDYKCYPCTYNGRVPVFTDANEDGIDDYGGCTSVCGEDKRFLIGNSCYKKCDAKQIINSAGKCVNCSDIGFAKELPGSHPITDALCKTACGTGVYDIYKCPEAYYCAPINCGTGRLHAFSQDYSGPCDKCPTIDTKTLYMNTEETIYKAECEACGNHMYLNKYCIYVKEGTSGICNNDSPDTSKWPNYPAGIGVFYRDNTGVCRRCDDQNNSYTATETECNSCVVNGVQIRRLAGGACVYGGCSEGDTFRTPTGCTNCSTSAVKVETTGQDATLLCNACHRRIMTTIDEKQYCVQTCDSGEWQDINGDCWNTDTDVGSNEIGVDELSSQLCRNASRTPTKDTNTGQVYCIK